MKNYKYPWKYSEDEKLCESCANCYDCGLEYENEEFPDMVLPNDLWEEINPSQYKGSGLLCPRCIVNRLVFIDKWYENNLFILKPSLDLQKLSELYSLPVSQMLEIINKYKIDRAKEEYFISE